MHSHIHIQISKGFLVFKIRGHPLSVLSERCHLQRMLFTSSQVILQSRIFDIPEYIPVCLSICHIEIYLSMSICQIEIHVCHIDD